MEAGDAASGIVSTPLPLPDWARLPAQEAGAASAPVCRPDCQSSSACQPLSLAAAGSSARGRARSGPHPNAPAPAAPPPAPPPPPPPPRMRPPGLLCSRCCRRRPRPPTPRASRAAAARGPAGPRLPTTAACRPVQMGRRAGVGASPFRMGVARWPCRRANIACGDRNQESHPAIPVPTQASFDALQRQHLG
jgi:hypothetical protein